MSAPYTVRLYREGDEFALTEIIKAAIEKIGPRAYSKEQVTAWLARHPGPESFRQRANAGDQILIAANESGDGVAYAILEADGHLDHLYCHPDHTRQKLADRLLAAAEAQARLQGVTRLYTEASELARPAFERAGYSVKCRRDFEIDDVPIHNFAMEKSLT